MPAPTGAAESAKMPALPVVVMSGEKTGQRFKVLLSSDANSLMLTEQVCIYNKAGNYPALLWNKAVPNSTFRPMVDIATLIRSWTAGTLLCVIRILCRTSRKGLT